MFNGERIKDIITEKKMTQTQVAKAMGMSLSSFTHMIGPNANPSAKNIELIADTLNVPIQELFVISNKYDASNKIEGIQYNDSEAVSLLKKIIESKDDLISEKENVVKEKENLVKEKERIIQILLKERGL